MIPPVGSSPEIPGTGSLGDSNSWNTPQLEQLIQDLQTRMTYWKGALSPPNQAEIEKLIAGWQRGHGPFNDPQSGYTLLSVYEQIQKIMEDPNIPIAIFRLYNGPDGVLAKMKPIITALNDTRDPQAYLTIDTDQLDAAAQALHNLFMAIETP